jgi:hypothetical protein
MSLVQVESQAGKPVHSCSTTVIPFSQVIRVKLPYLPIQLTWNRPESVLVRTADGSENIIPVPDPTRWAILGFSAIAAFCFIFLWFIRKLTYSNNSGIS